MLSGRISKNQGLLNQGLISVDDYRNSNIKTNAALAIEKDYSKAFAFGQRLLQPEDTHNSLHQNTNNVNSENTHGLQALHIQEREDIDCQYFLYINGHCAEDKDTAEDFYLPTKGTTCSSVF